jgi:hypothetical protein
MIWIPIVGFFILLFGFVVFRGAPYVPSQKKYVRQVFKDLYPLDAGDVLVDVGSGDGIVLRLASERKARAVGYELNPLLVIIARFLSRGDDRVRVQLTDFWLSPLPDDTTIVYGFMVTRDMKKMVRKMQKETDRLGRRLYFMTYGNQISGRIPDKSLSAYYLYSFYPLQTDKA